MSDRAMKKINRFRSSLLGLIAAVVLVGVAAHDAAAQASARRLDDARFIQGLREKGMKDLLLYFVEKYPPDDPVVKQEILIEQQKLNFEDASLPADKRVAAANAVLQGYRDLLKTAPASHYKRPTWRTEFAAYVIHVILPAVHANAAEFVEFGTPQPKQREAFDALATEVTQMMRDAADEWFVLEGDLPKRADFVATFENTGIWIRLREDIAELQLPLYFAWANYYGSMASKPVGSLGDAAANIRKILKKEMNPAAQAMVTSLYGRILLAQALPKPGKDGKAPAADPKTLEPALAELKKVTDSKDASPFEKLLAGFAVSKAMHATGKTKEAVAYVDNLKKNDFLKASPQLLIIAYDRQVAMTGNMDLYNQLFNDPAAGDNKAFIQNFVGDRFAGGGKLKPAEELKGEAPIVVLGQVEAMIRNGAALKQQGKAEESKKVFAQASSTLRELLTRTNLPAENAAEAYFKLGLAEFQGGQVLPAAAAWVDLATKFPQQAQSEGGSKNAVILMASLYKDNKKNPQVVKTFGDALAILQKNFGPTEFARQHTYTLAGFLREQGRFAESAKAYLEVPKDHPLYPNAMFERVVALHSGWITSSDAKLKAAMAKEIPAAVKTAQDVVAVALDKAPADQKGKYTEWLGDLVLMHAQVLAEGLNQPDQASAMLQGFDEKFGKFPRLIALKRPLVVSILMAQGKSTEAVAEVQKFQQQFPNEAGPLIKSVLDTVLRQTNDARAAKNTSRADQLGPIAVQLAEQLLAWAKTRPEYAEPAKILPFEVQLGDAYLAAGQAEKAVGVFQKLKAGPGGNVRDVLYGLERAALAAHQYELALQVSSEILGNVQDPADALFWPSWLISMQALDALVAQEKDAKAQTEMSQRLFTSILKLEKRDPTLGSGSTAEELNRLKVKHQPK